MRPVPRSGASSRALSLRALRGRSGRCVHAAIVATRDREHEAHNDLIAHLAACDRTRLAERALDYLIVG